MSDSQTPPLTSLRLLHTKMTQLLTDPQQLHSPDLETFSTPPTTPGPLQFAAKHDIPPSLSRRNSRPTSLHIDHKQADWNPDIELTTSPDVTRKVVNGAPMPDVLMQDPTIIPPSPKEPQQAHQRMTHSHKADKAVHSPCFVHSHLDQGAQLTDWLRNKQSLIDSSALGVAKSLQQPSPGGRSTSTLSSHVSGNSNDDEEDEFVGSLTKRLAETAVGVREMSKQLGRARVQSNIQNILIVTKARDNRLIKLTRELALYLMLKHRRGSKRGLVVYVDSQLRQSKRFDAEGIHRDHPELFVPFPRRRVSSNQSLSSMSSTSTHQHKDENDEGQLRYWTSRMCSQSPHLFDFVVTLGGDGTVLFTSWLFQHIVPPVLSFALGSLGFLTNFDFADHQAVMDSAIDNGIRVNLRMRFTCTVYRSVANEKGKGRKAVKKGETGEIMMKNLEKGGWEALEGGWTGGFAMGEGKNSSRDKEIMCFTTRPVETFEVLNDLVVDRGPSPYVSLLELFGDEHHMTTVQADGLTVSTPTGSTAYSLSAGGSLVHPEIPALLITPICPHTLSFRPMLLPDSMELRICVPYNSRSTAWASFDGRGRVELRQGDHIKVTASKYPFPTVCADKQSTDWFHSISRTLKWNERERQKSFVVVEEDAPKPRKQEKRRLPADRLVALQQTTETLEGDEEEDEVSDEEEEEDKFDIDDSSPEAESNQKGNTTETGEEIAESASTESQVADIRSVTVPMLSKRRTKSRSCSRPRQPSHSGVDSPYRYANPPPHPPSVSPRHVGFDLSSAQSSASSSPDSLVSYGAQNGTRDELHVPRHLGGRSRIPKDRDLDLETAKTPTPGTLVHRDRRSRGHSRSRSVDQPERRAFAVWGHDETDSNNSDSES